MRPFVSFFTVAIAATHGVYNNVNTRNAYAVAGVKIVGNKFEKSNLAPNPRVVYDSSDTGKIVVRKNTVK